MNETTTRMHRGHAGKLIGGVSGALAAQFRVDVTIVRVLFVIAAMVSFGMAVGAYVLLWVLTPPAPGADAPAHRWSDAVSRFGSASPSGHPVRDPEGPQI